MTAEERQNRINEIESLMEELNKEKKALKCNKRDIASFINNQNELSFIYPHMSMLNGDWSRSATYGGEFANVRNCALNTVDEPVTNKYYKSIDFKRKKVLDLLPEEHEIVVQCADEIIKVIAKYKKQYLESIGREDIVKAFNM